MMIGLDTKLSRNGDILHAPVGSEEAVMMSVEAGRYYGVNAVGARIWELLEAPKTIVQLCDQICEEFDVDSQTCEFHILKFVNDLIDNGIVYEVAA
jgi:Coenzyme PQQ synthesis protein D (PqqD)